MLTDPNEIEIISTAKQKNIQNPGRSRQPFIHIFDDFFQNVPLDGSYIDMGPGHFDFGEIIRKDGGSCVGLDVDPAVIALGKYKGFETIHAKIQSFGGKPLGRKFDGVFNKFTFNAFWHWDNKTDHRNLVKIIDDLLKPDGWSWIGPWNGVPKKLDIDDATIHNTLNYQQELFEALGFTTHPLSVPQAKYYGIGGNVANHLIFTKNLEWTPSLETPQ